MQLDSQLFVNAIQLKLKTLEGIRQIDLTDAFALQDVGILLFCLSSTEEEMEFLLNKAAPPQLLGLLMAKNAIHDLVASGRSEFEFTFGEFGTPAKWEEFVPLCDLLSERWKGCVDILYPSHSDTGARIVLEARQ